MWNASRLILLNAGDAQPGPRTERPEDRWILSRLQRAIETVSGDLEGYDFAHAALDFYSFFWSEFCDWYLEIVKPRLYDGDADAAANLLHVLERVLALAHPLMPFVTEEIWGYLPDREGCCSWRPSRRPTPRWSTPRRSASSGRRSPASARCGAGATWSGCRRARCLSARAADEQPELVARLARLSFDAGGGDPLARIGAIEVLASDEVDAEQAVARIEGERDRLRGEIERLERKLANEGFVAKAPADVVDDERRKLDGYEPSSPSWMGRMAVLGRAPSGEGRAPMNAGPRDAERYLRSLEPLGHALRARSDPQARHRARHAAAPLRLRPRGRHERQVVGDHDDRGAARGSRPAHGRLSLAPRRALGASGSRSAARRSGREPSPRRSSEWRGRGRDGQSDPRRGRVGDPVRGRYRLGVRRPRRRAGRRRGDRGRARRAPRRHQRAAVQGHGAHLGRARAHRVPGRHRGGDRDREARRAARPLDAGHRAAQPGGGGRRARRRERAPGEAGHGPRSGPGGHPPSAAPYLRRNFAVALAAAEAIVGSLDPERVLAVAPGSPARADAGDRGRPGRWSSTRPTTPPARPPSPRRCRPLPAGAR